MSGHRWVVVVISALAFVQGCGAPEVADGTLAAREEPTAPVGPDEAGAVNCELHAEVADGAHEASTDQAAAVGPEAPGIVNCEKYDRPCPYRGGYCGRATGLVVAACHYQKQGCTPSVGPCASHRIFCCLPEVFEVGGPDQ